MTMLAMKLIWNFGPINLVMASSMTFRWNCMFPVVNVSITSCLNETFGTWLWIATPRQIKLHLLEKSISHDLAEYFDVKCFDFNKNSSRRVISIGQAGSNQEGWNQNLSKGERPITLVRKRTNVYMRDRICQENECISFGS